MASNATLQHVARLAKVNDSTVSRAFSGSAPVAERTRQRIFDAAEQVGYRPSVAARVTRTGRTGFIGMVSSSEPAFTVTNPVFLSALSTALNRQGLCLLSDVVDVPDEAVDELPTPRIVREHAADGLLINYAFGHSPETLRLLERADLPAIWINQLRSENCVRPDDEGAAFEGTRYLLERGLKRVAYMPSPSTSTRVSQVHYSSTARQAGYEKAMTAAGHQPRVYGWPPMPPAGAYFERLGYILRTYTELLRSPDRPEAVLCGKDGRVMLLAACQVGLQVPQDLSVLSFDDDTGGDVRVAVDRLVVPYAAMGQAAVQEVTALSETPDMPRPPVVLPFGFHRSGTVV